MSSEQMTGIEIRGFLVAILCAAVIGFIGVAIVQFNLDVRDYANGEFPPATTEVRNVETGFEQD